MLVEETADAVLGLSSRYGEVDPSELLTACRRILSRRPTSGPLWWMAARVLTSNDVRREIDEVLTELREDRTASELEAALGHGATVTVVGWSIQAAQGLVGRGDVTVLVIDAMGEGDELARQLGRRGVDARSVPPENMAAAVLRSDAVLVEATIAGPDEALCLTGSVPTAAVAAHLGVPVWLIAGVGYRLPKTLYDSATARWAAQHGADVPTGDAALRSSDVANPGTSDAQDRDQRPDRLILLDEERLSVGLLDKVVCEAGPLAAPPIPSTPNFPRVPELERFGVVLADPPS